MTTTRRQFCAGMLAAAGAAPAITWAQGYPSHQIEVIVPASPGAPIDVLARLMAPAMAASMGQPLVIQNMTGSGGIIGLGKLARAPKDGYTIGVISVPLAITPALYKLPYDASRDITPVSILARGALAIVINAKLPAKDIEELIALARSKNEKTRLTYGSQGIGTAAHLSFEMFKAASGADFMHVPYKGSDQLSTALISGEIDSAIVSLSVAEQLVKGGRIRILGLPAGSRSVDFPEIPTLAEQGVAGMELDTWIAMIAPAGLPIEVLDRLNAEALRALKNEAVMKSMHDLGYQAAGTTLADAKAVVDADIARYGKVVGKLAIQKE